jgi:hypothetical protein
MFGFGKKKTVKTKTPAAKKSSGQPSREEIVKQALSNVRAARAEIGEEALDRIAAAIRKKEQESAAMKNARQQIQSLDQERVADNLRAMMRDDD